MRDDLARACPDLLQRAEQAREIDAIEASEERDPAQQVGDRIGVERAHPRQYRPWSRLGAMRILLTGFEPFAGRGVNPSWDAAQQLQGVDAGPARIDVLRVPVVWRESVATIVRELDREPADGLVIGGLSFGRPAISVEAIAHAIGDVPWQADNADRALTAERSDGDGAGPDALLSTAPVRAIAQAINAAAACQRPDALAERAGERCDDQPLSVDEDRHRRREDPICLVVAVDDLTDGVRVRMSLFEVMHCAGGVLHRCPDEGNARVGRRRIGKDWKVRSAAHAPGSPEVEHHRLAAEV